MVFLGLLGGAAGIVVAVGTMRILARVNPGDIPRLDAASIDSAALLFAVAVSIVTGIAFGVVPTLIGWRRGLHDTLRAQGTGAAGGAHGGRTRSVLTALEAAFAVMLLVGAGLMLRSFAEMTSADLGVRPAGVFISQLVLLGPAYEAEGARGRALASVVDNIRAAPGVTAVGASTSLPPTRTQEIEPFTLTGQAKPKPGYEPSALFIPMTPGYLEALGIPLTRGRSFDARDDASSPPVVVISAELARRHFAGVDPVGRQIDVSGVTRTIVGVAGDAVYEGIGAPMRATIYVPFAQSPFPGVYIAIQSTGENAAAIGARIRDAVRGVDPRLTIHRPRTLESYIADSVVRPRFQAWLLGAFGGLALLLATIGIYSVIAYGVSQRRAEIGIRLALGAPQRAVIAMMVRTGGVPLAIGIAGGLLVALGAGRVMRGLLYGVPTTDAFTFASVAIVFGVAGLLASYVPARRAARVDPLSAIRAD
jgi:putative ABC transport system permease protein